MNNAGISLYLQHLNELDVIFNAMENPVFIYNEEGILIKINQAGISTLGFDPTGLKNSEIKIKLKGGENISDRALQGEVIKNITYNYENPGGEKKTVSCTASPIKIDSKITGAICIWHDIEDRREKEKALNTDKKRLIQKVDKIHTELIKKTSDLEDKNSRIKKQSEIIDNLFANTHFLIALLDTNFNFIRVNKAYAMSDGRDENFFIGKNHFDLYPHEENEEIFRHVLHSGKSFITYAKPFSFPGKPERGTTYWDWNLNPIKDEDGNIFALILILLDVTARKNTEMKLSEAQRLSDIGALATTVAHELRSPLGVIQGTVYNVVRKNKDEKLLNNMRRIERKIDESEKIINNLLNYSRIKQPVIKKIHLYNFIDECMNDVKKQYLTKKVRLIHNYESFKNILVYIDPFQIREVLSNILNNAYQAVLDNEGMIEIKGFIDPPFIKIDIGDNGEGIEKEDIKRIFEPFFTKKSRGTGLGLAICKELLNLHNGTIEIESEKNKGTVVHITLPVDSRK